MDNSRPTFTPLSRSVESNHGKRVRNESDEDESTIPVATKLFRCGQCDKRFARIDHLGRHTRLHTQERPYSCSRCDKCFSRADLLKRHGASHEQHGPDSANKDISRPRKSLRGRHRINQACVPCAGLHLKCEDEKPCRRCKSKQLECSDPLRSPLDVTAVHDDRALSPQRQNPAGDIPSLEATTLNNSTVANRLPFDESSTAGPRTAATSTQALPTSAVSNHVHFADLGRTNHFRAGVDDDPANFSNSVEQYTDAPELWNYLQNITSQDGLGTNWTGLRSGVCTPGNLFELGSNTEPTFDDIDLAFLDNYNQNAPFEGSTDMGDNGTPFEGVESLQKASTWRFRPLAGDNMLNNISLPPTAADKTFKVGRNLTPEPLSYNMRDQILGMVLALNPDTRSALHFPSASLLDGLLQYFLASTPSVADFVHVSTFYPSQKRPELCAIMVAAGACLTPDQTLRKFGLVLHEAVRVTLGSRLEKDNSLSRDLQLQQASILTLKLGLWSGDSRRMEFAEGFVQPWTTMMRRGGWFRRKQEVTVPLPNDDGAVLDSKWRVWIEEESRTRLVYVMYQHDSQAAVALFISPVFSTADLCLPLPHAGALWLAASAQDWKTTYFAHSNRPTSRPSVIDLLHDLDRYIVPSEMFDTDIARAALLSATCGMIREYRQHTSLIRLTPNQWHSGSLIASLRLTELKKLIECIQMGGTNGPQTLLFINLLSMHLHINLEDVHLFAGVEGREEASRIFPSLKEWCRTPGARQAVWHAGQIVRHARAMPVVCDLAAVVLFQAALTLWTYGVTTNVALESAACRIPSPATSVSDHGTEKASQAVFMVTGNEDAMVQRFVALGRALPAIALDGESGSEDVIGSAPHILLSTPAQVMASLIKTLGRGYESQQARPHLVDNLIGLMDDLRRAISI